MSSTYLMKEKKDEKKMEEYIKKNINAIKGAMKNYKKLISASEGYCKSESVHANQTKILTDALILQSNTGINDLDQGVNNIIDILQVMFAGRNETARYFNDQIIPILKKNASEYPRMVSNFEDRYKNDLKRADSNIALSQKKLKAQPTELKQFMEEVKQTETLKQQCIVQGLHDTTKMVRELYCGLIQLFCNLFEKEKNALQQIVDVLKANEAEIQKMATSSTNFGEEVGELIKAKKQVLIDLKKLTPELRAVLKAAGLKRKDLCNPETVKLLITTVEQAVKEGKCDQSVLEQLTATPGSENSLVKTSLPNGGQRNVDLDDFEEIDIPNSNKHTTVSTTNPPQNLKKPEPELETQIPSAPVISSKNETPQPNTQTRRPPPPLPNRKVPPTLPSRSDNNIPPSSVNPPPPPNLNVPPPPNLNVPPPPPTLNTPSPSTKTTPDVSLPTGGRSFLDDINKGGHVLKKTEPLPEKKMTVAQQDDLTSMLANAMANRRKDIEADTSEEEDDDDDEWSD
ncbi:Arp2/3 complex-activating protein rickA, putative [Entamoeba dispar SAW760]|uniref:Arp2/3 complex-activating protein rickA, putative n=1 Tax=Entamoeba dispar (strain ATCC PRA-260 / SAW760) TaxID=370354 RepID=B0E6P3_ENTDS|nr:Arp2/3 complex-activating protein rickA, putative [Entamoeba dispar SAW760]EDR29797.1 Arp2/3 complex-activating protein rickA, putative [Entamoeba dispar SAW760]|eukprot:EDR29797.1 Arp2/3 complex-activating protein rickA, putative [Entamoeba dispar SAW760]